MSYSVKLTEEVVRKLSGWRLSSHPIVENVVSTGSAKGITMDITQEFLVLPSNGGVLIYGVRDFPSGTPIGRDAQKLRVVGPVWVRPPDPELTEAQWEKWQAQLQSAGFSVTVGPFWKSKPSGRSQPLEAVLDELLRSVR